jgi:ubiquinone/menaquinone biosynthesis C-methylase UbiE
MVGRIQDRNNLLKLQLDARVMDGHKLDFPDEIFDKIILHLILAVIPDPVACLREVERVLKPGGKISVFDKFVPANHKLSFTRKLINPIANLLFSDITRRIEEIVAQTGLKIISDQPADFQGNFRILLIQKPLR